MSDIPTGVVAFLFTDIVSSTRLWAEAKTAMDSDLRRHDDILRAAANGHGGHVFSTAGDSFAIGFASASDAIRAAIAAQRAISEENWEVPGGLTVRMGVHLGESIERDGDYFGPTVNTAARLMAAGHGGQILVSGAAADVIRDVALRDLGEHRLRDVATPLRILQVNIEGFAIEHPPLHSTEAFTSTLPQQRSSFVGRDQELARLGSMLDNSRIVTITGVGGAGKTRVAIEVGAAAQTKFPGGVFFVDLASLDDPDGVAGAVAAGIGINVTSMASVDEELRRFLETRSVLLVMDNCEHLLDPVAELVDELLSFSPGLKVLSTSREALEIDGEDTYRLPSLAADGAAFRLFVERATAVNDRFEVDDNNRETIVELCRRVDGMPLAIELAASRCRTATPSELLTGLDDRFALLRGGRKRGVVQRQRTLEATIEWSYELLEESERAFFRRLGVFAGSFLAEVVPTVTGTSPIQSRDLLDSLVAKSLIVAAPLRSNQTCFRLLETVKAFAIDRMVKHGEVEATAAQHADAYVDYCREAFDAAHDRVRVRMDSFVDEYIVQAVDLHNAVDYLVDRERGEDAVVVLRPGSTATIGTGAIAAAALDRIELLNSDHRDQLSDDHRAELDGIRGHALMDAGRFLEAGAAASSGVRNQELPIERRLNATTVYCLIFGSSNPVLGQRVIDAALAALADKPGYNGATLDLRIQRALYTAMLREYEDAIDVISASLSNNVAQASGGWLDFQFPSLFWLAHLTGREAPRVVADYAQSLPSRNRGYRHSTALARLMAESRDIDETARSIAELADTADAVLTGRLPLGESEFLVAYARLAQLRGEPERALRLLEYCAPRAPWTNIVMSEILGSIHGWSDEEWQPKRSADIISRVDLAWLMESREHMPALLADELARWR